MKLKLASPVVLGSARVRGLQRLPLLHKLAHLLVETLHFLGMCLLLGLSVDRSNRLTGRLTARPSSRHRHLLLGQRLSLLFQLIHALHNPSHLLLHCMSLLGMLMGTLSAT